MLSTNGALAFGGTEFGSSGRTRTYNPSVNSREAYSRLTLQTRDLDAPKSNFPGNWGDSGGTVDGCQLKESPDHLLGDLICTMNAVGNGCFPDPFGMAPSFPRA